MSPLANVLKMPNKIEEFLSFWSKHVDLPVLLWGNGAACGYFTKFMKKYSIPVLGIIDKKRSIPIKEELQTMTPEEAHARYDSAILVISAIAHKEEIEKEIANWGGIITLHSRLTPH